jgi:VWFA-related protein
MNRKLGRHLRCLAALAGCVGLAVLVPGSAGAQTFSGTTDVTVVEVPVQVVKDGEPVRGLTANDFEVFDGRKKVPITGFEVLDLSATEATPQAAAQIPVSARRHFLMLFDLSFSEPSALSKARLAALDVVKTLHPTDLVAVATYSSIEGPQLVLGFTPDRQQISAALDTLGLSKLIDRTKRDPLRLVLDDALLASRQANTAPKTRGAEALEAKNAEIVDTLETLSIVSSRADRTVQHQIVRNLTSAFTELARLMGEIEGRKYVVYLSEGFDSSLVTGKAGLEASASGGNDLSTLIDSATSGGGQAVDATGGTGSDERFGDTRTQNAIEKMLEEFRRADCQIQAVDIGGLRAGAEQGFQRTNGKEALFNMAKSTGGELYENFNNLSNAMGQMLRRTGVTYVLSFQPDSLKPDGTYRKLKVELKNAPRGARVVFRPGYYAPKAGAQPSQLQRVLEGGNAVMDEESGSIQASVLAAPFAMSGDHGGRAYVPVLIEVNGPSLLAGKQGASLPVEIYIYAIDQNGSVQDFLSQTLGLDLAKAPPALSQTGLKFFGHVELPPGSYTLRTLVRNGLTGASSLRVTPVEVPAFGNGQAALLPAFFPETPGRWVMVRENPREGQPQAAYPFMLKEQPYIPASLPVLTPGQPAAVVLQGYNLGSGDLKADVKVLSADGKEVPGGALTLAGKEGSSPVRVSATFQPPALQPGEYTLQVTLTDGAGKTDTSTARFAVSGAGTRGGR